MRSNLTVLLLAGFIAMPGLARAAVLANVGDVKISDQQVKGEYESATKEQRKAVNEDEFTRRQLVDNVINAEVLVMAAKKAGMDRDTDYKHALERFSRQYLATHYMQKAIEPKLSSSELKKFFDGNKNFFDSTQVCAHHIVVQNPKDAEKLLADATAKGADFEALAVKNSIDPTVQENKGNLGCFTRDKMVPEFTAAAFAMTKGQVRGPVRTMYGYHVIKLDEIKPGAIPGYDEVEQRVKDTYRMKLMTELVNDLRTKSKVKVHEDEIKNFKL